jgi:hypothetical protein
VLSTPDTPDNEFCGKCGPPVNCARSAATEAVHPFAQLLCTTLISKDIWYKILAAAVPADLFDEVKRLRDECGKPHAVATAVGKP